jgi:hypothetical protein
MGMTLGMIVLLYMLNSTDHITSDHYRNGTSYLRYYAPFAKDSFTYFYMAIIIAFAIIFNVFHCRFMVPEVLETYQTRVQATISFVVMVVS